MTDYDDAVTDAATLDVASALVPPDQSDPSPDRLVWLDDVDDEGTTQPWAQLEDETDSHYAHFQYYCSLPLAKRTYQATANHYGRSTMSAIPKTNDWSTRVAAWDAERARIYQIEVWEELQEMGRRHGPILKDAIEGIALPLQALAKLSRDNPGAVMEELGSKGVTQLLNLGIKSSRAIPNLMQTERLVRGLPTEITHNVHSGKVEHVHTPDLSEVEEIIQGLHAAGSLQLDGDAIIDVGEEADTTVEQIHEDDPDDQTDSLSSS